MVEIGAIVRIKGPTAKPREAERLMTRTLKTALQEALRYWHRMCLPRHFDDPRMVMARYGNAFEPRSAKYQRRKTRAKGHTRVNEWSGETKAAVTGQRTIGGSSKRAWIRLTFPNKARRSAGGKWTAANLDKRKEELTAINEQEAGELKRVIDDLVCDALANHSSVATIRIR